MLRSIQVLNRTALIFLSLGVGFMQFDDWLASASGHRKTERLLSARDLGTAFVSSSPLICGCA